MQQILLTNRLSHKRLGLLHAGGWLLYIVYEQSAIYITTGQLHGLLQNSVYYGLNIGSFYLHLYLLKFIIENKKWRYTLAAACTLAELLLILLLKYAANLLLTPGHRMTLAETVQNGLWDLHRTLFFIGLATLTWAAAYIASLGRLEAEARTAQLIAERDRARLETSLAVAQNAYYQHQLNPHLLLNSLAFIYSQVRVHSQEASQCVLLLADLLRFCLAGGDQQGLVRAEDELTQVGNLIRINRLRFGAACYVETAIGPMPASARLIPLVLLTLTENIFKHGLLSDPKHPARLDISADGDGQLHFSSFNHKKRPDTEHAGRDHLGLGNISIRLEQAYPGRYRLDIRDLPESYRLTLTLPL